MGVRLPPPPAPKISPAEKRQKLSKLTKGDRQGSTTKLDPQEALGTSSKRKIGVFGKASAPESRLIVVDDVSANKSAKFSVRQSLGPVVGTYLQVILIPAQHYLGFSVFHMCFRLKHIL